MMDYELPEMKKTKHKNNMYTYYVELDSVEDDVNSMGAAKMQINDTDTFIDNNIPGCYPDYVFSSETEVEEVMVNGNPVTPAALIGGYHPTNRPPQRPR